MIPTITAFKNSPDRGRGLARDMRVRWALEEIGQGYEVRLVTFADLKEPSYKEKLQPFGQIPSYQEGELILFESGAIVFHIAEKNENLLPKDPALRARVISWMFAALNTVEPPIFELNLFQILERDKSWFQDRLPILHRNVSARLEDLSKRLGSSHWLIENFSAADILMVTVLRRIAGSELLAAHQNLVDYIDRAEARPAYQRAFQAQLDVFNKQS